MFDDFNVNRRKNEGFLTSIPCIPILEYGQSHAPLVRYLLCLTQLVNGEPPGVNGVNGTMQTGSDSLVSAGEEAGWSDTWTAIKRVIV